MAFSASASAAVIVPNVAAPVPSDRGGALFGTVRSWIIHPSYQPLSLLLTNSGSMSRAARGLGRQGGGGCSPLVRPAAGMVLACAGRGARPTIANMETQPMTAAANFVITSFDARCVIVLPSRQLLLCGDPLSLVH